MGGQYLQGPKAELKWWEPCLELPHPHSISFLPHSRETPASADHQAPLHTPHIHPSPKVCEHLCPQGVHRASLAASLAQPRPGISVSTFCAPISGDPGGHLVAPQGVGPSSVKWSTWSLLRVVSLQA